MSDSPAQPMAADSLFYRYNGWLLGGFAGVWVISLILMFTDPSVWARTPPSSHSSTFGLSGSIGVILLFCVIVPILALDWHGFTTLHGSIKWRRMKAWQKGVVGYFFIGFAMFLLGIYFVQAFQRYRQEIALGPLKQRRRVAEMEAELGIMPPTEGVCRDCHKPMQVGAQFCAYCGVTAFEMPKVCPSCAAVTLPDAKFCPKCRTPLSPQS